MSFTLRGQSHDPITNKVARFTLIELIKEYAFLIFVFMTVVGTFYLIGLMPVFLLAVYGGAALLVLLQPNDFISLVSKTWILFLFPVIAFASSLWSVDPAATLKNSVQFIYSAVIGTVIGSRYSLKTVFTALGIAMSLCVLLSLANIYIELVPAYKEEDYVGAERYFLGVYPQKNVLGGVLYLCALGLAYLGIQHKKILLSYIPMLGLLPIFIETKSTTALLFYLLVLTMPVVWCFMTQFKNHAVWILGAIVIVAAALFVAIALEVPLIDKFLGALGKDRSLTGRTVIWGTAFQAFDYAPFLGVGYQAFWTSPIFAADVQMIRAAVLDEISGFHNGHLEVVVACGMLGLLCYWSLIITMLITAFRNLAYAVTPASLAVVYYVCLTVIKTFTESALFFQHDIEYMMFCTVLVACVKERGMRIAPSKRTNSRTNYSMNIGLLEQQKTKVNLSD